MPHPESRIIRLVVIRVIHYMNNLNPTHNPTPASRHPLFTNAGCCMVVYASYHDSKIGNSHRHSNTLGGPWTKNSEGPQTNGLILVEGPLDPRCPWTLSTLSTRLLRPWPFGSVATNYKTLATVVPLCIMVYLICINI